MAAVWIIEHTQSGSVDEGDVVYHEDDGPRAARSASCTTSEVLPHRSEVEVAGHEKVKFAFVFHKVSAELAVFPHDRRVTTAATVRSGTLEMRMVWSEVAVGTR